MNEILSAPGVIRRANLLAINVNDHTEKKGQLTYLSWAWAWAEVLKIDECATWYAHEFNGLPVAILPDNTAMVKVSVVIDKIERTSWLPVMDHKNKAIVGPDSFSINTAIMRALAKAIAMHGLGLYIYAGEDLPANEKPKGDGPIVTPKGGIGDDLPDEWKAYLRDLAMSIIGFVGDKEWDNYDAAMKEAALEQDQEIWLDRQLDSKTRAAIKARNEELKKIAGLSRA